jgi:hypothetical protein
MPGKTTILSILLILNLLVLMGQIWPQATPPFANVVNIIFLVLSFLYFSSFLLTTGKMKEKKGEQ